MWRGDYVYVLENLILKDFRMRYRNASLGVFWSLLNPLVMMVLLTFVFTKIFQKEDPYFPVFLLCGLVPFNFFSLAWGQGTMSVVDSARLIKRVQVPREVVPMASVLANCTHLAIQMALLLIMTLAFGKSINRHWLWLPVVLGLEVVFVCGLTLITSSLNVFVRDTRYVVESVSLVMFYLAPVFYSFNWIPPQYTTFYELNPIANLIFNLRLILLEDTAPRTMSLVKMSVGSFAIFGVGAVLFHRLKRGFYEYL